MHIHKYKRKVNFREVKRPILIVCEDSKSSVYYLQEKIRDLHISPVAIEVDGKSDSSPISVVDYAIKRKRDQQYKSKKEGIEEYENVFCVMDVDDHPSIKPAILKANANGLIPIVSNQCFELWYLLHFMNFSTGYLHRKTVEEKLEQVIGKKYLKSDGTIYQLLKNKGDEKNAIHLSKKLKTSAEIDSDERNPLKNPSTDVYVLIERLNKFLE